MTTRRQAFCLIIRADADAHMGTGHVMRCLALAQAWLQQGGKVFFVGRIESRKLIQRLEEEGCKICYLQQARGEQEEIRMLTDLCTKQYEHGETGWLVLDGYHFHADYQQQVKNIGLPLLVIDDYAHLSEYHADLLLNQNVNSGQLQYCLLDETQSLFGNRFLLLRDEFAGMHKQQKKVIRTLATNILVTMGGADPVNATGRVIGALKCMNLSDLHVKIIVGPANPQQKELEAMICNADFQGELLGPVDNMAPLMEWADMAITAGGTTCWELAYLGVPCLVCVLADNQLGVADQMEKAGAGMNCGWTQHLQEDRFAESVKELCVDKERRSVMSRAGQRLVDGLGARRVVSRMLSPSIHFRKVTLGDCQLVFDWANDTVVRQASFHEKEINWEEHRNWFQGKLIQEDCLFWVICCADMEIGQVRFEVDQNQAVISISLSREKREKGSGSRVIAAACHKLFAERAVNEVIAYIRQDNGRSIRSFLKAGFAHVRDEQCHGVDALVMNCPAGAEVW